MPAHGFRPWITVPNSAVVLLERSMQGREALVLYAGLGLSTSLVVGALGLRWPALLPGLLPPLASLGVWHWARQRLRHSAAAPPPSPTCLLDASVLKERLRSQANLPTDTCERWREVGQRLEALRALAAACIELDPTSAVALLVMLERLVQRALVLEEGLHGLSRAPTPGSLLLVNRRLDDLQEHLRDCLQALSHCHEAALEQVLDCPDVPATIVLSTLLLKS